MGLKDISAERSFFSYARVQRAISRLIRNRRLFFSRRTALLPYLNVGCGIYPEQGMVNIDWHWCPGVDVCYDLRRAYPFPDDRFKGIYSEHCIDGIDPRYFKHNLREMHRVLAPGGTLRLVFCDAELYIDAYVKNRADGTPMPYADERGTRTRLEALDFVFHHWGHLTLVDQDSLFTYLREVGFQEMRRVSFREGRDKELLRDQEVRRPESLYVEAVK